MNRGREQCRGLPQQWFPGRVGIKTTAVRGRVVKHTGLFDVLLRYRAWDGNARGKRFGSSVAGAHRSGLHSISGCSCLMLLLCKSGVPGAGPCPSAGSALCCGRCSGTGPQGEDPTGTAVRGLLGCGGRACGGLPRGREPAGEQVCRLGAAARQPPLPALQPGGRVLAMWVEAALKETRRSERAGEGEVAEWVCISSGQLN